MKHLSSGSFGCTPRGGAHQLGHEFRRHDGLEVEILSQESSSSCFVTWLIQRSFKCSMVDSSLANQRGSNVSRDSGEGVPRD